MKKLLIFCFLIALLMVSAEGVSYAVPPLPASYNASSVTSLPDGSATVGGTSIISGTIGGVLYRWTIAQMFGIYLGTLTDGKVCTYASGTGKISCTGDYVGTASASTYTQPDADNKLIGRTGNGTVGVVTTPVGLTITSSAHTAATNTIKTVKPLILQKPDYCDETGAKLNTTKTDGAKFGQCQFADDADKAANYAIYELTVPPDIDTTIDLTARIYYRLGGADTGTHTYTLSLSSVAASASSAGSFGSEITFNAAGDASGADGDIEITPALASAATTLTGWRSAMTAGQLLLIKLTRDGDDAADASTVDSYSNKVVISYGSTQ